MPRIQKKKLSHSQKPNYHYSVLNFSCLLITCDSEFNELSSIVSNNKHKKVNNKAELTVVGHQVFLQLISLIFQYFTQVRSNLTSYLLHKSIQLAQIIRQPHKLIQGTNLKLFVLQQLDLLW